MDLSTRHANPTDSDDLLTSLVEAFSTDPFWVHFMPDAQRPGFAALPGLTAAMTAEVAAYLTHGHTYIVDGQAAALWTPPGIHSNDDALNAAFGAHVAPELLEAALPLLIEMAECRPAVPHFYLHLIGARDTARGKGLGSLLLERITRICDAEGQPAYLEATTPRSAMLYARHGFVETSTIEFSPGVTLYTMLRDPA